MKADIHPKYQNVVFQDVSSNFAILTRSTMTSKETIKWEDGKDYPLVKVEISSQSHPFYTGKHKVMDAGGRVDKFPSPLRRQADRVSGARSVRDRSCDSGSTHSD
jgi:large subunit ribosomal protein L31